ncbi:actin-related protein 2/3 complex subunit 1A-like [Macadamia integrifolia]|uniref:actin-related protein 2/3 complex subunit 1A-like n=1 Tax=Macadamia integrifolia TaxID=60698 RepID=UPI001C4F1867|nr:actin-related protein 2/3 complex subunit 1A-like [Macadamia integrifolia]
MRKETAKDIWDRVGDSAKVYQLLQKAIGMKQGNRTISKHYNTVISLWEEYDHYRDLQLSNPEDETKVYHGLLKRNGFLFCLILLATASTDGKCRVFSTFIKGVDLRGSGTSLSSDAKFGEQIIQLDLSFSWAFGVKWSPSGNTLAYVGHNSTIYFVDDVGPSPLAQNVAFRDLPLRDVLFISERMVIGVGFDCNPMVFAADERGIWCFVKFLAERKMASSSSKYGSQFSEAFGKLYGQKQVGNDAVESSRPRGGVHENCINCILPLEKTGDGRVKRFSTSGLDGKVVIWDLEDQEDISLYS